MSEDASPPQSSVSAVIAGSVASGKEGGRDKPRQIRRRNRVIASCLPCRQRKIRCDKLDPCGNCKKFSRACLYIAPALDTVAQQELAELKDKLSNLEESLGRDVIRRAKRSETAPGDTVKTESEEDDPEDDSQPEDEKDLEPTPLAVFDQLYDDDADDELLDLGFQMGKMRISDRVGGLVRPKMAEELHASLGQAGQDTNGKRQHVFLQSLAFGGQAESWQPNSMLPQTYLAPGTDYIAPSSTFFFPEAMDAAPSNELLPSRNVSDQLIAQYLLAVHPVARVVHRPSFEKQYIHFWDSFNRGTSPPPPIQSVIFAAMFSAAVSLADPLAMQLTGMPKAILVERLRTTAEMALSRAHFLRTTKVDTLQAFVMYLVPLCRNEISRAHSALVGTAIRLAQCMGLHRDGSLYGLSPVDTHVRRLVWHQLCYLDIRTCEATGPRPQIRKDEYDTKHPLNVNDDDLLASNPPTEDSPGWTEITLTKMKIECYDLIRHLWDDMQRIDRKKTTLTATLGRIQRFRASTGAKYASLMQGPLPLQILARQMYRALSNRCFVIILQRYVVSTAHPMPERLRQILIEASISCTEAGIILDVQPEVKAWSWYRPAFLQYHACLLLLLEVYARPDIKEAPRIWPCVDYVFELYPHLSPKEKAEGVLLELRDRLGAYHNLRKMKITTDADEHAYRHVTPPISTGVGEGSKYPFATIPPNAHTATYSSPSESIGSRAGGVNFMQDIGDTAMQAVADIDWNEWDKYFPKGSQSVLGNVDVSTDFDMGPFDAHSSYLMLQSRNKPPR